MLQTLSKCAAWLLAGLIVLTLAAPAQAVDITFAGNVSYRERITLPPDAELVISLVSLPGQHRVVSAQAALGKTNSPFQFSLAVRSSVLADAGSYGLVAEIWSGGYAIFSNARPVPVDPLLPSGILIPVEHRAPPPHDAPEQVLLPVEAPNPLLDTAWTVTSIGGEPILPQTNVTLSIADDFRAGGSGGCNSYFSEAEFAAPPLTFSPIASTRMACDPAIMAQEARFFAALEATAGYDLSGDALQLVDAAGVALVGLVRQP
ncbi:META domain-containing protein [Devosia sp. FKR38]|uniref:META domain-containing protein n=1 Tax=Devosia sp. FKR38 TaxID=2562312 RepID=UPI0010C150F8|nr:META domain-containing protein [Devosia sp. FKR38]